LAPTCGMASGQRLPLGVRQRRDRPTSKEVEHASPRPHAPEKNPRAVLSRE
jgi:hypothetical protein